MLRRLKANKGTNRTLVKIRVLDKLTVPIRSMVTVCPLGSVILAFWTEEEWKNKDKSQQTWCVAPVSMTQAL